MPPAGVRRGEDVVCDRKAGHVHGNRIEARSGELGNREGASLGSTRVSGRGQNASASRSAAPSKRASARAGPTSGTWAIRGLNDGRPLTFWLRGDSLPS